MIEGNSSSVCQRQSAWHSNDIERWTLNATTTVSENVALDATDLHVHKGVKVKNEGLFLQQPSFPRVESSPFTMNLFPNNQAEEVSRQKRFIIFDRSGQETRMLLSTICSPVCNPEAISADPNAGYYRFPERLHAFNSEKSCPMVPDLFGDSDENRATDEGSDHREDTEEINALLYSSEDDIEEFAGDSEDDDEISTDHSPVAKEEFDEEVTSLCRSSKRRKLLTSDSQSMEKSAPHFYEDESVVNLNSSSNDKALLSEGRKRLRDSVHGTLKILQKLIPGSKSKDPLSIIEESIAYLKSLKAESLYTEEGEGSSCHAPLL